MKRKIIHWGERSNHWKGGRIISPGGYIKILQTGHPFADRHGYVMEHRLMAEKAIGYYLPLKIPVHHSDGNKQNNKNNNLIICQNERYHQLLHDKIRRLKRGPIPKNVKEWKELRRLRSLAQV